MGKIETIEEIDNSIEYILERDKYNTKQQNLHIFVLDVTFTYENASYIFNKVLSIIEIINFHDYRYIVFKWFFYNPTFKNDYIIKCPNLPWDYFNLNPNFFDKNFIITNLDKIWNFNKIFVDNILSFSDIKNNLGDNVFSIRCGRSFKNIVDNYEDYDMSILNNNLVRENINDFNSVHEHPNFDFSYIHLYPECDWNWEKISLHGDMTIGEANKILNVLKLHETDISINYDGKLNFKKKNAKSLMKCFGNLMLQPWMNSWFIKTHVKDEEDRRFYLRKLKRSCYEGRSRKRNELLWRELLDKAMSPERLFYWYLDNYELDNLFTGCLPDDHPRAKPEYQIRPGIYPSERLIFNL